MSQSAKRGSLMGLRAGLPPLPRVEPVATTAEMEERILGTAPQPEPISTDVFTSVKTSVLKELEVASGTGRPSPAMSYRKEPTVLMNAKLPVSLHARLKRTAQFNDISMTDILIRAIEAELATGRYTAPPETWGSAAE